MSREPTKADRDRAQSVMNVFARIMFNLAGSEGDGMGVDELAQEFADHRNAALADRLKRRGDLVDAKRAIRTSRAANDALQVKEAEIDRLRAALSRVTADLADEKNVNDQLRAQLDAERGVRPRGVLVPEAALEDLQARGRAAEARAERMAEALRRCVAMLEMHDGMPRQRGEFPGCGIEFPVTIAEARALLDADSSPAAQDGAAMGSEDR